MNGDMFTITGNGNTAKQKSSTWKAQMFHLCCSRHFSLFLMFHFSSLYVIIFALLYGWLSPTTAKVRVARRPAVQHTLCIQLRRAFCRLMGQWMHCLCYTIKLTWLFTHPSDLSHFPLISNKLLSAADHSVALHVWFGRDLHRMSFLTQLQRGFVSHLLKSSETELGHILKYIKIQLLMWLCLYVWTWKYLI